MTSEANPQKPNQRPAGTVGAAYVRLSRISPIVLLVIYVVLIPAFGGVYWLLAQQSTQQFYAQYARLEPTARADTASVEENLRGAMFRSYRDVAEPQSDWELRAEDLHATHLTAPVDVGTTYPDYADFTVSLIATRFKNGEIAARIGGPQATVRIDTKREIDGVGAARTVCHSVNLPGPNPALAAYSFDLQTLFRPSTVAGPHFGAVCWSIRQENQFEKLLAGWAGDPRPLSGFFGRMVYFSATTITTVGFGDIVPLSGWARLVVGIEAVSGWLLAGLFLNAVAWRAAHSMAGGERDVAQTFRDDGSPGSP